MLIRPLAQENVGGYLARMPGCGINELNDLETMRDDSRCPLSDRSRRSSKLESSRRQHSRRAIKTSCTAAPIVASKKRRRFRSTENLPKSGVALAVPVAFSVGIMEIRSRFPQSTRAKFLPSSTDNRQLEEDEDMISWDKIAIDYSISKSAMKTRACVGVRAVSIPERRSTPTRAQRRRRSSQRSLVRKGVGAMTLLGVCGAFFRGVGALVFEGHCTEVTLFGTELELEVSPRVDTSIEAVAVGIDGTIVASQDTYDRLLLDREAITELSGLDIPFRNLWSDRLWRGTVQVTFTGAAALAELEEGSPPDFNCMNDHYGMSFVKGEAGEGMAEGTLTSDKVLNWSLLGPLYTNVEGITAFEPTAELVVRSTTNLVAARQDGFLSGDEGESYHYFLSEPSAEVDSSSCPDPCTGEIITYYWSRTGGRVYELDRVSSDAEPAPCWLPLFDEVADGPPPGGATSWDPSCIYALLDRVEEEEMDKILEEEASNSGRGSSGAVPAVIAAVVVIMAACVVALVVLQLRRQKTQKAKKMKTTDEAWGEGLDGSGQKKKPRPPTGRFKLGSIAPSTAAVGDDGGDSGIPPPPTRGFSDVSMGSEERAGGQEVEGNTGGAQQDEVEDIGSGDMVYPLGV